MDLPKIYKDKDINIDTVRQLKVGIIGFGNQGRAQALNLRDSGVNVMIGLRDGSRSIQEVLDLNLEYKSIDCIVQCCEVISMLVPDQVAGEVYRKLVHPYLISGQTLLFSHGYNIHYKLIKPPNFVNIVLAAPSGSGTELRKRYSQGSGIPGLIAIHQDFSGNSFDVLTSYCKAIGLTQIGVFLSTFKEETETDLFGEQVVLTGGIPKLIQSSYEVLLEFGVSPITAWFVCYYELKTIVDMFHSKGFNFMNMSISDTAEYGGVTRGSRIVNEKVRDEMRSIFKEIQDGRFHKEWMKESEEKYPLLKKMRMVEKEHPIEKFGNEILKKLFDN